MIRRCRRDRHLVRLVLGKIDYSYAGFSFKLITDPSDRGGCKIPDRCGGFQCLLRVTRRLFLTPSKASPCGSLTDRIIAESDIQFSMSGFRGKAVVFGKARLGLESAECKPCDTGGGCRPSGLSRAGARENARLLGPCGWRQMKVEQHCKGVKSPIWPDLADTMGRSPLETARVSQ
jgi:hypothetical protein